MEPAKTKQREPKTCGKLGEDWSSGKSKRASEGLKRKAKKRKLYPQASTDGETSAHGSPGQEGAYIGTRGAVRGSRNQRDGSNSKKQLRGAAKK
jgi:hypothetical protein